MRFHRICDSVFLFLLHSRDYNLKKKANKCYVTFVGLEIPYNAFMLNKLIRKYIRLVAVKGLVLHFSPGKCERYLCREAVCCFNPGKCECYLCREASSMLFQSW